WAMCFLMVRGKMAVCAIASIPRCCVLSRSTNWKAKATARTANCSKVPKTIKQRKKEQAHEWTDGKSDSGRWLFLGRAGFAAQAAGRDFDARRLFRRRRAQRDLSQSRHARRSGR